MASKTPYAFISSSRRCIRQYTKTPFISSFPRPFKFHFGVSYAGKPADSDLVQARQRGRFAATSPVGKWRDNMLKQRNKSVQSADAGQDFFYIQEVRACKLPILHDVVNYSPYRCVTNR